ncbi:MULTISPECIES: hypothetical protein [Streptomyces]|uniref:Uncharacterized protein n=1 Tax=Streptomyces tsukubensis (strain DSM 42081 / NBRC 108919 / NRRL 18488 / 9993) TaxID=1114943 RepID=I2MUJ7_STRT9|nr:MULTISPECIES: hypothetical protein [Streptomyces]AZK92948.1 hypothetical protein B7R87_02925 [Streptomyces tsukubensis]EIF88444.1 hypothetical protein [Streptomyces tsukubensis NRRL18488]MYS64957.1 hypothetical protein [Streptomyces sp. SID5473]QKM70891.1 hypothetical protein STSU_030905 [Streptomyces tsukubensis NRRL18488]TAI40992.1 hypothetical protein EWI31_28940 [Streptomyces tsukubensis]
MRRKNLFITGVTAASLVAAGTVYFALVAPGPGDDDAEITAGRLCSQLGPAEAAAKALNTVLPTAGSYTVDAETAERRVQKADGYATACRIRGDDKKVLFVADTEMLATEPVAGWFDSVRGRDYPDGETRPFGPGDSGRASARAAAVLVPCAPAGQSPEGARSLSVTVRLPEGGRTDDTAAARDTVRDLALAVARQSHRDAGCDTPAGL